MKRNLMAAVAVLAVLTASGAARAQDADADIAALKAQSAALKRQNAALEARLNKLEKEDAAQARKQQQAQTHQPTAAPAADSFTALAAVSPASILTGEGPITWNGVTFFGTIDAGLGYATHGLPLNSKYYYGNEMLTPKSNHSYFGITPNGLQLSNIGVKGATELLPGLSGVFWASTLINPHSGELQSAPGAIVANQGLNYRSWTINLDGARGGQAFNDQLYVGLSDKTFGQLTFGRHRSLASDLLSAYDPTGVSSAFSIFGSSGTYVSGQGVTETGRWDNSLKYRVQYDFARFAAMYKFADSSGGCNYLGTTGLKPAGLAQQCFSSKNDAAQVDLGFDLAGFSFDGVLGYFHQGVYIGSPLTAAQLGGADSFVPTTGATVTTTGNPNSGTLAGTVSDMTGGALGVKYTWNQWKLFGGWSHTIAHNPKDMLGIGAQNDQGGFLMSSVNNASFPHARLQDSLWVGFRYAYDAKTDIVATYEHVSQNAYGSFVGNGAATAAACDVARVNLTTGASIRSNACAGNLDQGSIFVDYHFTKRFDVYGGLNVEAVNGGLASGYLYTTQYSPTVGARYSF
jgi:predicted porin